jgi:DNA-binding MltR family transcriptional regulator
LASPGKPKLRALIGQAPSDAEEDELRAAFSHGRPLEIAIFSQALIEHQLEKLLRRRFNKKDDSTWARLTDDGGPLGTFSAKLTVGFAFGLYDEITLRNLNKIREIRNVFAHSKRLLTFNEPAIVKALKELSLPPKTNTQKYKHLKSISDGALNDPKWAFQVLCFRMFIQLSIAWSRSLRATTSNINRRNRKRIQINPFFFEKLGVDEN